MRKSLRVALAFVAPVAVIGCSLTVSQIASDVSLVDSGVEAFVQNVSAMLPADAAAKAQAASADLRSVADAIAASPSAQATKPNVQQIVADVNVIVTAVSGVPGIPANVLVYLKAAQALLPSIESAVGIVVAAAPANAMSPAAARMFLSTH